MLLVGSGPADGRLRRLASELGVADSVLFTGQVPAAQLPAYYDAGDVFAMPCRTRRRGLDVEGLGIVYLEASATGLPVVAGESGGAPDAVLDGETGYVIDGGDVVSVGRLRPVAPRSGRRPGLGEEGLAWVDREWRWDVVAEQLDRDPAAG